MWFLFCFFVTPFWTWETRRGWRVVLLKQAKWASPGNGSTSGCAAVRAISSQARTSLLATGLSSAPLPPLPLSSLLVPICQISPDPTQAGTETTEQLLDPNYSCHTLLEPLTSFWLPQGQTCAWQWHRSSRWRYTPLKWNFNILSEVSLVVLMQRDHSA